MTKLSREIKEALKEVQWEFAKPGANCSGKEIRRVDHPVQCTSLYLTGLGIKHLGPDIFQWYNANDGAPRCSRPLRAALLKACGLKEPR